MRPEDELVRMVQGRNPMEAPPGMEEEMPVDGPPGPPPGPPEGMPEDMAPSGEMDLPKSAVVMEVQGNTVVLQSESGKMIKIPMADFPIPPQEGMQMVQAIVEDVRDGMLVALVGDQKTPVELPMEGMQGQFDVGDYFWMPAPPAGPEDLNMMG
jgi:hypothetical protein